MSAAGGLSSQSDLGELSDSSDSSSSSSSDDGETIGTSMTGATDADAKARLRAKIRAQAGSLLNQKVPPVPAVAAVKKSTSRNVPPTKAAAAPVISDDEGSDKPKLQKTGEQSEESPNAPPGDKDQVPNESETLTNDQSENSSMHDSKRSVVRFEGQDADAAEGADVETGIKEKSSDNDKKSSPAPPRPGLAAFKSGGEGDEDNEGDDEVTFDVKEDMTCSDGATIGMVLCAIFVVTWAIAIPIALAYRPKDSGGDDDAAISESPTPTSAPVDTTPTAAPEFLLDFPQYTQDALNDPTSPQSLALDWLLSDPEIYTYSVERQTQRFALATFYYATKGDEWTDNSNWLEITNATTHECFWYSQAPVCNNKQQYTILDLSDNNLVGSIPPEVALLTSLTNIHLADNSLTGGIPPELSMLPVLSFLDLQDNKMTEPLPTELGLMSSLSKLWLNGTRDGDNLDTPTTTIPTELAALTMLEELHLASNKLGGQIPSEFGVLPKVNWLTLRENLLAGQIPSEISTMPALSWLDLGDNKLTGEIPTEIGWLNTTLRNLQLESNELAGTMPVSMNRLTSIQEVWLYGNMFTGNVPIGLCYFKRIGKVQTIRVDCDEVGCDCACQCGAPVEEPVEDADEPLAPVADEDNVEGSANTTDVEGSANATVAEETANATVVEETANATRFLRFL